jgi:hypothetical protein
MIKVSTPYSLKIRRALIWPTARSSAADERELLDPPAPQPEPLPAPLPAPKPPGERSIVLSCKRRR